MPVPPLAPPVLGPPKQASAATQSRPPTFRMKRHSPSQPRFEARMHRLLFPTPVVSEADANSGVGAPANQAVWAFEATVARPSRISSPARQRPPDRPPGDRSPAAIGRGRAGNPRIARQSPDGESGADQMARLRESTSDV